MMALLSRHGARALAAGVLGPLFASAAQAAVVAMPSWELNAWGRVPTEVTARPDGERCGPAGHYFAKWRQGDGDAELILPGSLKPGQAYRFSVQIARMSDAAGWVDVFFRKSGAHYETTAIQSVQPSRAAPSVVTVKGIYDAEGPGAVRISLRQEGLAVCLSRPRLETISRDEVGDRGVHQIVEPTFFGIHLNKLGAHKGWPSFDPGIVRMWDTGTTWQDLQPEPEDIDWRGNPHAQRFDLFASHVKRANPKASLLVTLGMTPSWAASARGDQACGNAYYGRRSCMPPLDMEDWRRYVKALARRYKGQARYWELLNESDMAMHWVGSPEQLISMARIAREELKAADPANVLMGPNVTVFGLRVLNDFLRLGGGQYVDAISVHAYIGRDPALALSKLRNAQELVRSHGLSLPMWNSESGLSCTSDADCAAMAAGRSPMDGVSALAQAYLGQAAQGIRNISYHTWEGGVIDKGGLPLVDLRGFRRPSRAGEVLEVLRDWMVGADVSWLSGMDDALARVSLVRGGRACVAAWTAAGELPVKPELLAGAGSLTDALGQTVMPQGGVYRVGTLPVMGCRQADASTGR